MTSSTLIGSASFAWQSDYAQFYLVDGDGIGCRAPFDITAQMTEAGLAVVDRGLVIYTNDCLQQHLWIAIYDGRPVLQEAEPMTGATWTKIGDTTIRFASGQFQLSSPSHPQPLPAGPFFQVPTAMMNARITWKEFEGERDDSVPVEPDVIAVTLWPQA